MKASIKLRDDEQKPPLLRAKVPVSIFNLPFVTSFTAGDPSDLSFSILTSFPSFPSLKLSYHPLPNPNPNPSPFTLTLKCGTGHLGSPLNPPLQISFLLSASPDPAFSIRLSPRLGHFSLTSSAASLSPGPNPKENGGAIYRPIPMEPLDRRGFRELISSAVRLNVRTAVPMGPRAGLKVRWAVRLPEARGAWSWGRLPYLTVDKISVERLEEGEEEEKEVKKELGEKELEEMKGMCFWMGKEVEELRKERDSVKESVEVLKKKFSERRGSNVGVAAGK